MSANDSNAGLSGILDFLRAAEALKVNTRSAHTSAGNKESVAIS
jgi:hypothetical protein